MGSGVLFLIQRGRGWYARVARMVVDGGEADGLGELVRAELHQPARDDGHSGKTEYRRIPASLRNVECIVGG
jgi:hypothetical protein